jgi:hypothetical protein
MTRIVRAGLCAGILILVSGCGKATHRTITATRTPGAGSARTNSVSPRPTKEPSAAARLSPAAQNLLTRPTARPPNVAAQFEYVGGAGPGACFEIGSPPRVEVLVGGFAGATESSFNTKGIATYGQPLDVCVQGMGRGPISVSVHGPKGFTRAGTLPALPDTSQYHYQHEWTPFDWVPAIEPSWPIGRYVITAQSRDTTRTHALTLVPPREPGIRVLGPSTDPGHNTVAPSSRATVFLTGFPGGSVLRLSAYRTRGFGPQARFFGTAIVPIPTTGNTVVHIPTGRVEGRLGSEPTFILTARAHGRTLFAPFTVSKTVGVFPNLIVGALPSG